MGELETGRAARGTQLPLVSDASYPLAFSFRFASIEISV
jgi:hypothetical protein